MSDHLHFNLFTMNSVEHVSPGSWTIPGDQSHRYTDREYWTDVAQTAERAGFDAIFFADVRGIYDVYDDDRDPAIRRAIQTPSNAPQALVPAMAEVTDDIGFAITRSTSYVHPYQLARELSTLDHVSDGRIAFNVVTSYLESAAENLGLGDRMEHDERYDRADEFMDVCYRLWEDSWEDDAVVRDADAGTYTDPEKVHAIDYDGEYFSIPGPHGCEPSPQRTPVIYQAGSSDRGREFAAKNAEGVFVSQPTKEATRDYIEDMQERVEAHGRDPDSLKFFPGIVVVTAETDAIAQKKYETYKEHISVEGTLSLLSGFIDMDLSELEPDQAVEHIETDAIRGTINAFTKNDPDREWTVEEVAQFAGLGTTSPVIVGGPETVADELESWRDEVGVDGFNLKEVTRPGTLQDFAEYVVPVLRERGMIREGYDGETLRENMFERRGLPEGHHGA
ncbi:LLM class flavin-dependent oxidoreductase [Natronobacterium texcoconense]|uniref:FMN-dependent oxidoreductase, nitrilotriacetate monooxygenase family n=1 Tax=Natronobacterium texcoconense TaxID=1095778 RepID=A0A1H1G5P3_NATTX|nr:LLM class flavin-dependent oxidoreductase [Natronobacterium texcoconense]SDR08511.1 FMN-dependent oxidoreductase, nitrilotriacetate monooxygenase family [Natronobacterium texcoconense]